MINARGSANPMLRKRACGVLAHLSSLDGSCAIGELGRCAHDFVDWCASAGLTWWQMLPVGPIGLGNSPYSSTSSFAGEPLFLSLDSLADDGLLARRDVREAVAVARKIAKRSMSAKASRARTDYDAARIAKEPAFLRAFESFRIGGGFRSADFHAFARRESWLKDWQLFNDDAQGYHAFLQFQFDRQWTALRAKCAANRVKLLGDLPIFVTLESSDVAAHQKLFRLDRAGRPEVLTGVPPDCFSKDGQLWGHPHYRWSAHRAQKFAWWIERIAASLRRFDGVRIDHFVGFHHAYEIPVGARTARRGRWRPQAGVELLTAARRALGSLPLVAEDLGAVTPEVIALRKQFALPGMKVLQHAFDADDSWNLPHHHEHDCVVYPATHDNDTTRGWWKHLGAAQRQRFIRFAGSDASRQPHTAMLRIALESPAQLAIVALQDVLGLDELARMNMPGQARNQWQWRLGHDWPTQRARAARTIRALAALTGRIP